eukprot:CAMPEP_0183786416 /NCGR_PEP_ID=MMETSP0739-20130205/67015_1 /TAXON_ID=385413 /ORGANISM="Thalassiosira miniscula, Strain CCMP1093" /LENGTH=84 /DNA_ID=CAMNT_0026030465 /DNA_START=1675 /DNA_END=1925 /DNA_ORIENTATION=+
MQDENGVGTEQPCLEDIPQRKTHDDYLKISILKDPSPLVSKNQLNDGLSTKEKVQCEAASWLNADGGRRSAASGGSRGKQRQRR